MFQARVATIAVLVLAVSFAGARPSAGRQQRAAAALPAYTLVQHVTFYDADGKATPVRDVTRYASARGDWRYVWSYHGGPSIDTIYVAGRGVYYTDRRGKRLARLGDEASGRTKNVTADELTADSKYVRVEYVMGMLTYVKRETTHGYTYEWYFAPELGSFPIKTVLSAGGCKEVSEPASLTFGEPARASLRGEESYPLDDAGAVYDKELGARATERPAPQYARGAAPPEMDLQVYVDEEGYVTRAVAVSWHPLSEAAAIAAALRARFKPKLEAERPVKLTGVLTYEPDAPQVKPYRPAGSQRD